MIQRLPRVAGAALLVAALASTALSGAVAARRAADNIASIAITSTVGTFSNPLAPGRDGFFTFTIAVHNFTLDAAHIGSKVNRPGFGHYHVYADGINPAQPFKYWIQAGASTTVRVGLTALARAGVGPGVHTLYVALANNDHSLVEPLALAQTYVRVTAPPVVPSLAISGAVGTPDNPLLPGDDNAFTFNIAIQHFTLDGSHIGAKANRPGFGHYHIYADSIDPRFTFKYWIQAGATTTVRVTLDALAKQGISSGTHTLFVALANNDHSLLQPLVMASTVVAIGPRIHVAELSNPMQPLVVPKGGKVTLHVSVTDFRLDPRDIASKTNIAGAGHYHVYVNTFDPARPLQNYVAIGAGPSVDVTAAALARMGVTAGVHALYVVLANNDHTLVVPITAAAGLIQVGS